MSVVFMEGCSRRSQEFSKTRLAMFSAIAVYCIMAATPAAGMVNASAYQASTIEALVAERDLKWEPSPDTIQ